MKESTMKTGFAAFAALLAVLAFSSTASACERHMQHKSTSLEATNALPVVPPTVVEPRAVAEDELVLPQSKPELATSTTEFMGFGGCSRMRKEQTVYLTQ
jgi:hypothetical protein